MKINIDLNIKNQKWSSIEKHVDRKHEKYSNQNINLDLSKNNLNLSSNINARALIKEHYQPYIDKHDAPIKENKSRAKPYKSIKNYLKRRRACPESTWVIKAGTMDDNKTILKQLTKILGHDKAIKLKTQADNLGLWLYSKGFNQRNKYLKWTNAETNIDECSPHVHARIIPIGFTQSKRFGQTPSSSITKALELEFHDKNNKVAMHHLHEQEDPIMINAMNKAYKRVFHIDFKFTLTRSHNSYSGLGEKQFELLKREESHVRAETRIQFQRLERVEDSLTKQNTNLRSQYQSLLKENSHYKAERNTIVQSVARLIEHSTHSLEKQNSTLSRQNKSLKSQLSSLNSQQNSIKNQINKLKKEKQSLKTENNQLELSKQKLQKIITQDLKNLKSGLRIAKNQLAQYQRICSPKLVGTMNKYVNKPKKLLGTWLIEVLQEMKKEKRNTSKVSKV